MRMICSLALSPAHCRVRAANLGRLVPLGTLLFVFFFFVGFPSASPAQLSYSSSQQSNSDWVMTWSAEFNGPDGSPPNPAKWTPEGGGNGWGNNELQSYTSRPKNIHVEGGNLVIEAFKEEFTGSDGIRRHFTSGRLSSQGLFAQKYGRFEARIQIPSGHGVWPAFWLLGDDVAKVGWPACGEIDVMENVGREPRSIRGSLHGPGYYGSTPLTTAYALPQGRFSDGFHLFAVEWEPQVIRFYVDGELYASKTPRDLPPGTRWVFDHPFFVVLNLAVGGDFPGKPDKSTVFPQRMLVDYVRVYTRK
jgi:beta-glucanase (GH16 family)